MSGASSSRCSAARQRVAARGAGAAICENSARRLSVSGATKWEPLRGSRPSRPDCRQVDYACRIR